MFKRILKYTILPVAIAVATCFFFLAPARETLATNASAEDVHMGSTPSPRSSSFSAKGSIQPIDTVSILAPIGGQVDDFSLKQGDTISQGELAFPIKAIQINAGCDGVIRSLQGALDDSTADVQAKYGALCYIERDDIWHIAASTTNAYDDPENRDVYVGQIVRVQHGTGDSKVRGEGTVIAVNGKEFTVELPRGDFDIEDSVKLYLESSKDNATKEQIGSGKITRADALPVFGEGKIASILVTERERVSRGQALFLLDGAEAHYDTDESTIPEVRFTEDAVISEIMIAPGQFVAQGQLVMTILPSGQVEAVLEVDELDISKVMIGQTIRVTVDSYDGERTGIVKEIRSIGQTVLDTTKFLVSVSFEAADDLMIGMHVTGHWD